MWDPPINRRSDEQLALLFPKDADVLTLAGDCAVGKAFYSLATRLHSITGAEIVCICGNHEFYYQDIDYLLSWYRDAFGAHPGVHFLENESIAIDDVTFIGATLWTNFSALGQTIAERYLNDQMNTSHTEFYVMHRRGQRIVARDILEMHDESVIYIATELNRHQPDKTIVVTHFPPSLALRNRKQPLNDGSAYYSASLDNLLKAQPVRLWVYGHNHYSNRTNIDGTELVSNQLGYPGQNTGYNRDLTVII
jgi:predicted phosphohydrolase